MIVFGALPRRRRVERVGELGELTWSAKAQLQLSMWKNCTRSQHAPPLRRRQRSNLVRTSKAAARAAALHGVLKRSFSFRCGKKRHRSQLAPTSAGRQRSNLVRTSKAAARPQHSMSAKAQLQLSMWKTTAPKPARTNLCGAANVPTG